MLPQLRQISKSELPTSLKEISDPPQRLYIRGKLLKEDPLFLAVIGSRANTEYGRTICKDLIKGLAGTNVVIVSGLALGIDSIAHRAALDAKLKTIAFPGSGLNEEVIYPRTHIGLARQILDSGGALLSEFEPNFRATPYCFAQRNRLIAGISSAVLVIEAAKRSGALMTARLASEYNRDVFAVPGSVFSSASKGANKLIKTGAALIRGPEDLLEELGIKKEDKNIELDLNNDEKKVFDLLKEAKEKDNLLKELDMPVNEANVLLSSMELKDLIEERMGKIHLKI